MAIPKTMPRRRKLSRNVNWDVPVEPDPILAPFTFPLASAELAEGPEYGSGLANLTRPAERSANFYAWTSKPHVIPQLELVQLQQPALGSQTDRIRHDSPEFCFPRRPRLVVPDAK